MMVIKIASFCFLTRFNKHRFFSSHPFLTMCITLILRLYFSKKRLSQAEHFRLHNRKIERNQSRESSQINKMFENGSQRLGNGNGNNDEPEYSEPGNEYSSR